MTDVIDRACELEQQQRDMAMAARNQEASAKHPGYCDDCAIEIPAGRLKAYPKATRCIDCQQLFETRQRLTGGKR